MRKSVKILVVDDETIVRESLKDWLTHAGYHVFTAEDGLQALEILDKERMEILVSDLVMPNMDGMTLMKKAKEILPDIQVIIITAYASVPTAIKAIKEGAYDYIEKPICPERVESVLDRLIDLKGLIEENISLRQKLEDKYNFENIIAKSPQMQRVIEVIKIVAKSNATILITGPSGTGKELVARAIHTQSPSRDKPFVAVSCAALPENLLESELFGHEKGSFTGAYTQKKGKFELADQGTFFLDEIGEISANTQAHLLRVLEEKTLSRVGGNEEIKVDVRIISATNKDLKKAVANGEFREDLYYRLNVVNIELPPLKERPEDIPLLAEHFLDKSAHDNKKDVTGFSPSAMEFLLRYDWPGNVRELKNAIERAVILAKNSLIELDDLPEQGLSFIHSSSLGKSLKDMEKNHIIDVLNTTKGNYSKAASILGITRMTLYNKVKEYNLDVK